jgi:hypothetical protein
MMKFFCKRPGCGTKFLIFEILSSILRKRANDQKHRVIADISQRQELFIDGNRMSTYVVAKCQRRPRSLFFSTNRNTADRNRIFILDSRLTAIANSGFQDLFSKHSAKHSRRFIRLEI